MFSSITMSEVLESSDDALLVDVTAENNDGNGTFPPPPAVDPLNIADVPDLLTGGDVTDVLQPR